MDRTNEITLLAVRIKNNLLLAHKANSHARAAEYLNVASRLMRERANLINRGRAA